MARDQEQPHCCQDPRPDAQVQALPPRHREEAAGHRPGHLGGPFLCFIRFILRLLFYKTLTMRAVSHLLKNNQPPPTHTRENKFGSHVRFIGLLKSKQVSRVTETFESLSPRFPFSEARERGAPARPSAAAPSPVTLVTGGLAYVYKHPFSPRPAPVGFSTQESNLVAFPPVILSCPPRPSEGHSPAAGRAGAAGFASVVPMAVRALPRKGTVGGIQSRC